MLYFIHSHHMPVRLKDSPKVHRTRLQYASWLGNTSSLLIVVDNDMFIKRSPYEETDHRITNTGQPELIYNGIPDWLYQGKHNLCDSRRTYFDIYALSQFEIIRTFFGFVKYTFVQLNQNASYSTVVLPSECRKRSISDLIKFKFISSCLVFSILLVSITLGGDIPPYRFIDCDFTIISRDIIQFNQRAKNKRSFNQRHNRHHTTRIYIHIYIRVYIYIRPKLFDDSSSSVSVMLAHSPI